MLPSIFSHFIRIEADYFEKTMLVSTAAIIDALWYSLVAILVTGYNFKKFFEKKELLIQRLMGALLIIISIILFYKIIIS